MDGASQYLYKILSAEGFEKNGSTICLPKEDDAFIHFSTDEQLGRIIDKYWSHVPTYWILKIETKKTRWKAGF